MGYKRADEVLPKDILRLVQKYVSGEIIYVPKREETRKKWGSNTDTRKKLDLRNRQILQEYRAGATIEELARQYFLTAKSIQRILRNFRTKPPMEAKEFYQEEEKIE